MSSPLAYFLAYTQMGEVRLYVFDAMVVGRKLSENKSRIIHIARADSKVQGDTSNTYTIINTCFNFCSR